MGGPFLVADCRVRPEQVWMTAFVSDARAWVSLVRATRAFRASLCHATGCYTSSCQPNAEPGDEAELDLEAPPAEAVLVGGVRLGQIRHHARRSFSPLARVPLERWAHPMQRGRTTRTMYM